MNPKQPSRGEVWTVDLNPTIGHEQAGRRPALVVSMDLYNHGPADMVILLPITSRAKGIRSHIPVAPPEGGLRDPSFIKVEDIRAVSKQRLTARLGAVSPQTLGAVGDVLKILLGLP